MSSAFETLLAKVRHRLGDPMVLRKFQDHLATSRFLRSHDDVRMRDQLSKCMRPADYFDFAAESEAFPSHQIKSEITGFLEFASKEAPKVVMEIGTARGGTHFLLGRALKSVELTIALDLFVWNSRLLQHYRASNCQQHFINEPSGSQKAVAKVEAALQGRKIDLLFIDGDHNYAGVKSDFEIYRHHVRDGGLIAFHDIVPDYKTTRGIDTGRWAGDVPVLWKEIKDRYEHWQFVENPEQDGLGIGVLHNAQG